MKRLTATIALGLTLSFAAAPAYADVAPPKKENKCAAGATETGALWLGSLLAGVAIVTRRRRNTGAS